MFTSPAPSLPTAASAVALSSATNSLGVSVGAPGSLMVMKSTRRPSAARNATIRPEEVGLGLRVRAAKAVRHAADADARRRRPSA